MRWARIAILGTAIIGAAALEMSVKDFYEAPEISFSTDSDKTLSYPSGMEALPDEHTTFIPGGGAYRVFAATNNKPTRGGAAVLETSDLLHFQVAPGYGPRTGGIVFLPPNDFTDCRYTGPTHFDQNYAAPGSVVQDPTLPKGNLIMVYEAEQHCVGGGGGKYEFNFWASVGLARSSDDGRTWPSEYGGSGRYAILQVPGAEPSEPHPPFGDAIPSAFVDDVNKEKKDIYVYVAYKNNGTPTSKADGQIRVARARLGGTGPLEFKKWYQGGFTQPGIGGSDSPVTPVPGCTGFQAGPEISYNDALEEYMLIFSCTEIQRQNVGTYQAVRGAWYYSTATSLEKQDWTSPRLIENTQRAVLKSGGFDGRYFNFMSPGCAAGHLGLSGKAFLLNDSAGFSKRAFVSREFKIAPAGPLPPKSHDCAVPPPAVEPDPCTQVLQACRNAGFEPNAAGRGAGLLTDCFDPIVYRKPRPRNARLPMPRVNPQVAAACAAQKSRSHQP